MIYIRYGRQAPDKAREIGQFRFLKAESDSAGVSIEVVNVREVGSEVVPDLQWVNNSGNSIGYSGAYELYRLKGGKREKIETGLGFTDIAYCINSGSVGRIRLPTRCDERNNRNDLYPKNTGKSAAACCSV